jgi:MFS family permease
VCLLLPVSKGADWGWGAPVTLALLASAVVVLGVWGWWELRVARPLVDLRGTARGPVLLTNIASIAVGFAMFATALVFPQLLQLPESTGHGHGLSMLAAGLCLAPGGLVMVTLSPVSARLSAGRGPRTTLVTGCAVIAGGYLASLLMLGRVWQIVVAGALVSAGVAIAYAAMPTLVMNSVPPSETGAANGFNTLMRAVGTSACSAVTGVLLAHLTQDAGGVAVPSLTGFRVTLALGAAAAAAAALVALLIPRHADGRAEGGSPRRVTGGRPGVRGPAEAGHGALRSPTGSP